MAMFKSQAVHALWITHLCSAFGYYLLIINLSIFIREALGFKVLNVSILSAMTTYISNFPIVRMVFSPCFPHLECCFFPPQAACLITFVQRISAVSLHFASLSMELPSLLLQSVFPSSASCLAMKK